MKYSLPRIALKLLQSSKLVILTSILTVALATCLIITLSLFSINANDSLNKDIKERYGDIDILLEYENITNNRDVVSKLDSNNEISQFSRVVVSNYLINDLKSLTYTVGIENDKLSKSRYHYQKSLKGHQVIMNQSLAASMDLKVGNEVVIENEKFQLVEIIKDYHSKGLVPDILIIPYDVAKEISLRNKLTNWQNEYILIKKKPDSNVVELTSDIKTYGEDLKIDIIENDPLLVENFEFLNKFTLVLSILVIVVTSILLISNFEIILYKIRNQFAILRTLGSTTKQLSSIVFIQSSIINILGLLVGYILAFVSDKIVYRILEMIFSYRISLENYAFTKAFLITIICGVFIQFFMLIPMYKSSKILPLEIINKNEDLDVKFKKVRRFIGVVLLSLAVIFTIFSQGIPQNEGNDTILLLGASGFLILGTFILLPLCLPKLLTTILPIFKKFNKKEYYIAISNLVPHFRKNSLIIFAVSFIMLIAVFGSVMLNSVKVNEELYVKEQFPTPIVLKSRIEDKNIVDYKEISKAVEKIPSVTETSSTSTLDIGVIKAENNIITVDYQLGDLASMEKQKLIPNTSLNSGNIVIVSKELSKKYSLKENDSVSMGLYAAENSSDINYYGDFIIGGVTDKLIGSEIYIDWKNTSFITENTNFKKLYISTDDVSTTLTQLSDLKREFPAIQINNYNDSLELSNEMFYQRWIMFIAVITSLCMSLALGVFNSFIMNMNSKRKEFAVLRSLGITPKGVKRVILTQTTLYLCIGLILGIILGYLITFILSLMDSGRLVIEIKLIVIISIVLLVINILIFHFFSQKINKQGISHELSNNDK